MFSAWVSTFLSVAFVSVLSLVGVFTLLIKKDLQGGFLLYFVSFSVGGLFGGAFFHLIPEASEASGFTYQVAVNILVGILSSLVVEQCFRWRHSHLPMSSEPPDSFAYMNLFGDAVHNLIDGISIGGSYLVSTSTGLATTLAICLHELPQELGDFGVLLYAGFGRRRALLYNFIIALTAFIGAAIALILNAYIKGLTGFLIPFAAGNFIYIAGSDLIPELSTEEKLSRTLLQLAAIVLGLILMFSMGQIVREVS